MEELLALQQQLAQIQETSIKNRLSDRIIVDLIEKLIKEYDLKVYHTSDGQGLITPQFLSQTISQIVKQRNRIAILELPNIIGVSSDKIEAQIEKDCNIWDVTRVSDELFHNGYIIEMCEEINEELQQKQYLSLVELMQKYQIPSIFLKLKIMPHIGGLIQGIVSDDKLTTNTYIDIESAKLKGILTSRLTPISFQQIQKEYYIQNSQKLCEYLINANQLNGKIIQGQFYCQRFLDNQEAVTKKFFDQNFYVEFEMLQKQLKINKPKEFLKTLFKDNVLFLESCGMNKKAIQSKKEQIQELLINEGFTNLQEILPTLLSENDIDTLFQHMQIEDIEIEDFLIYYKPYLDKLAGMFKQKMIDLIYQNPQKLIEQQTNQSDDQDIQASAGGFTNQKKKQPKKQTKSQQKQQSLEIFSQKEIWDHLIQTKSLTYDDCNDILYKFLQPRLQSLYESVKVELFEHKKSASAQFIQDLQKKIEEITLGLMITQRSLQKVLQNNQQVDTKILVDNCLFGYRLLVENIVVLTCKKFNIQLPQTLFHEGQQEAIQCGMQQAGRVFKNKNCLIESLSFLPKEQSKSLKEIMEMYMKKQFVEIGKSQFLELFNIRVTLEKKNDKNFLYFVKHNCKDSIKQLLTDFEHAKLFNNIIVALLTDLGMYFVGNYDAKFNQLLTQILSETIDNKAQKDLISCIQCKNSILMQASFTQQLETKAELLELISISKLL